MQITQQRCVENVQKTGTVGWRPILLSLECEPSEVRNNRAVKKWLTAPLVPSW